MIQRWKMSPNQAMVTEPDGEYVEYDDHIAECDGYMSELHDYERTVKRLRSELEEKDREIARLKGRQKCNCPRCGGISLTESTDILHDEVARRIVADKRIKELEKALEPIRGVWTRYDDYPMFGPSGAEYAEAVKRCMWILEKEVSDG